MSAPAALDRSTIVAAATRLVERVGAGALTMRMLADELGASTMAAYRHVPNKETLLVLVADAMMERVPIPPESAGTWQTRLRLLERAAFRELAKATDLWSILSDDAIFPSRERLTSAVVAILLDAGFDARTAALAHEMFFGYVQGQLKMRGQLAAHARQRRSRRPRPGGSEPVVLLGGVIVDGREQVIDFDEYFDFGLDVLLTGLHQVLATSAETAQGSPGA